MKIIAIAPAHNEESQVSNTVDGLLAQSTPPEHVIVISDNSTDDTIERATAAGAECWVTIFNDKKKAGTLNSALSRILPSLEDDDVLLIQDADTVLAPGFTESALQALNSRSGAVGGIFHGESGHGLIGQLQRSEYTRYARQIERDNGSVRVLSGTASVFLVSTLRAVQRYRERFYPGEGSFYDTSALTEDNRMTLDLKALGYKPVSPPECLVTTELMPTWRQLWKQRRRWQRGALDNLRHVGWTKATKPYILRQIFAAAGAAAFAYFLFYTISALVIDPAYLKPGLFGLIVSGIFIAERVVSVRRAGLRAMGIAALLVVEIAYDAFLTAVYAVSLAGWLRRSKTSNW